ncbi:MAG: DUF3833 family protein, partial [Solirubrobacterales bacterium]
AGEAAGNALRWRYVLALPVDGKVYNVDFDDWMFLMDDKVMLNRSLMSKFGYRPRCRVRGARATRAAHRAFPTGRKTDPME